MMVIVYHDEIGVVCQEIEPSDECSISFLDGKAYFTSNEIDYKIDISLIIKISNGAWSPKKLIYRMFDILGRGKINKSGG